MGSWRCACGEVRVVEEGVAVVDGVEVELLEWVEVGWCHG